MEYGNFFDGSTGGKTVKSRCMHISYTFLRCKHLVVVYIDNESYYGIFAGYSFMPKIGIYNIGLYNRHGKYFKVPQTIGQIATVWHARKVLIEKYKSGKAQ